MDNSKKKSTDIIQTRAEDAGGQTTKTIIKLITAGLQKPKRGRPRRIWRDGSRYIKRERGRKLIERILLPTRSRKTPLSVIHSIY